MKPKKWSEHICFSVSDRFYEGNKSFFLKWFERNSGVQKLLDLGCGDGTLTSDIAEVVQTAQVYGIDCDREFAVKAKENGLSTVVADLNNRFPFGEAIFDIIAANQVLEHLWNTDNFFREINRVLKKGGYAVISTPNLSSLHSIFFILLGQQTPVIHLTDRQVGNFLRGVETHGHYKAFNVPSLVDLSEYYGFSLDAIGGFGFYFFPLFLQKILSKFLKRYAVFLTIKIRKIKSL